MPESATRPGLQTECDVLVVGGGPGGSTAAAWLARRGRDVVVLEKDRHPRFHIGESLLPANLPLFDRLGITEAVKAIGVYKPGAEFVSDAMAKSNVFMFASAGHLVAPNSYQVRRAEFDQLLFEHCRAQGARAYEGTRVTEVALAEGERPAVTAVGPEGATTVWRPRFLIDASGRDTLMASRLGLKAANKRNNTAAIFGHFEGVEHREGASEGIISIHLVDDGWFWMIPLPGRVMSVGLVASPALLKRRRGGVDELFWSTVRANASIAGRMRDARALGPLTSTGNYSYRSRVTGGERFLMIGDAFAFIDPIFSSGVMIAMSTGELGAAAVDRWLADPVAGRRALRTLDRKVRRATTELSWLIYRINDPVMRFMLLHPNNRMRMRDGLIALLAGQFFEGRQSPVPMLAFKAIYYWLRLLGRIAPAHAPQNAALDVGKVQSGLRPV